MYFESKQRSVLSNPINVNLVLEEQVRQNNSNPIIQNNVIQDINSSESLFLCIFLGR